MESNQYTKNTGYGGDLSKETTVENILQPHLFELKTMERIDQIRKEIADTFQVPFDSIKIGGLLDSINFIVDGENYNIKL